MKSCIGLKAHNAFFSLLNNLTSRDRPSSVVSSAGPYDISDTKATGNCIPALFSFNVQCLKALGIKSG